MDRSRWFFHPIIVFIFSIVALGLSLYLYIYWYMKVSTGLKKVIVKFNLDQNQFLEADTWVVVLVLSILVGIILVGIFTIFVYNYKTLQLFRLQHNFINNFTHELKTPVTSLKLYLETFVKHEISRNDQLKYLSYMINDVNRLSDNINRILSLSRIESNSYGGQFQNSELYSVIESFCRQNRHLFGNAKIQLHNPTGGAFYCNIIPSLFEMLLLNIITNAIKYNRSPTPKIDIIFEMRRRHFQILFSDNGIGIQKQDLKKIFRKFYQVGNSDDMTAKGSGLGLYMVQNIVKIHKWKIFAESRGIGKGSVFSLILPNNENTAQSNRKTDPHPKS